MGNNILVKTQSGKLIHVTIKIDNNSNAESNDDEFDVEYYECSKGEDDNF